MKSGSLNRDTGALSEQRRFQLEEESIGNRFFSAPFTPGLLSLIEMVSVPKEIFCSFAAEALLLWVCKGFSGDNGMGHGQKQRAKPGCLLFALQAYVSPSPSV